MLNVCKKLLLVFALLGCAFAFAKPANAAGTTLVTITVTLPSGAPAKGALVRMYTVGANYMIVSLGTARTNASGKVSFRARPGVSFKAEYGDDGSGRPKYIGSADERGHETSLRIALR